MAGSKATRVPNVWDTLRNQNNQINRDFALSRRVFNPQTIAIPPSPEIPPAGNSGSDSGNALLTAGGTMIGPIAFFPILLSIQDLSIGKAASATSRVLDISGPIGAASTRIIANGGVGTTDLEFIKGGQYAGQFLNIQGIVTQTITIKNDASGNGSEGFNIRTQGGGDLILEGNANILLIFDSTQNQWAVITSGAGGSTASRLLTGLTADDSTVGVIPWDNNFFFGDTSKITATATPGVFKLLQGDSYTMEALLQVEMVDSGGGSDLIFNWQEASAEGGPFTDVPNTQSVAGAMEIGKATITTQPHAIALVTASTADVFVRTFSQLLTGTFTRTIALSTIAEIETVGTSGTSGGGADSLGQLSDVAISPDPPIANDILQFSTTSGLWENQPGAAGGGLLTDLSNLAAGAIPLVDMSLNNFDLENVTDIRMNAAGTGVIDNIQHLDFFQVNHNIQSFGDRIDYKVDSPDFHDFIVGSTSAMSVAGHGINVIDVRFDTVDFVAPEEYQITQIADILNFNVPTDKAFRWSTSDVLQMELSSGIVAANQFTANQSFFAAENAGFVAANGRIGTLGGDVIIGSGGNSVNVTDLFNNTNSGQFADDTFNIFNAADPTKIAQFNAAPIGTGITRTYSLQNANGTLALLDGVQQNFSVNVGLTNNNLVDVGGIFTTSGVADIGQNTNYFDDLFINQIFFFGDAALGFKIAGNVTDGFDFVVPDTSKEFDFFFDGGTTPSWIIRPTVIDAQGGRIEDLEEVQFDGLSVINPPNSVKRIGYDGNDFHVNIPTGGRFNLKFNGTTQTFVTESELRAPNVTAEDTLLFLDSGNSNPATGQMARSGSDIFVSTTDGVKNFKDIGAGGGATGTIESALWTDGETDQFDFFVWHSNSNNAGESSGSAVNMLQNILYYVPFFIGKEVGIIRMGLRVQAASGTYTLAGGIYSNRTDGQNYPATRVASTSSIQSGAGFKTLLFGGQTLTPGLYWLAFNHTGGPSGITIDGLARGNCISIGWKENGANLDPMTGYFQGHSSSSLPLTPDDEMGIIFQLTALDTNAHYVRFTT